MVTVQGRSHWAPSPMTCRRWGWTVLCALLVSRCGAGSARALAPPLGPLRLRGGETSDADGFRMPTTAVARARRPKAPQDRSASPLPCTAISARRSGAGKSSAATPLTRVPPSCPPGCARVLWHSDEEEGEPGDKRPDDEVTQKFKAMAMTRMKEFSRCRPRCRALGVPRSRALGAGPARGARPRPAPRSSCACSRAHL